MGRNSHSAKDYEFERDGNLIVCSDGGDALFSIFDEGQDNNLINAYMIGVNHGKKEGRTLLQREIKRLLEPPPPPNMEGR